MLKSISSSEWVSWVLSSRAAGSEEGWCWSRLEPAVLAGVGVEAGLDKILSTPTPGRSSRIRSGSRRWVWTGGYASLKTLKDRKKGEWCCVDKVGSGCGKGCAGYAVARPGNLVDVQNTFFAHLASTDACLANVVLTGSQF